jgi:Holliday junction DNA helicase RuvA
MFKFFKGKVIHVNGSSIIVANDLFGIEILTPYEFQINQHMEIFIYTNYSSDNTMSFYGLNSMEEMNFFELLISVPGLGCKIAIKLLHTLGISGVANCIYNKDQALIIQIPGIGNKIANRIINDLFNKVPKYLLNMNNSSSYEIINGLVSIGYDRESIIKVLSRVDKSLATEEQLRQCMILLQSK